MYCRIYYDYSFSAFLDVGKWNDDPCYAKKNYMCAFKVMTALIQAKTELFLMFFIFYFYQGIIT